MKKGFDPQFPATVRKVLLHTCCAPCSSAIIEWMMQHDLQPVIYYCNPNIYPHREYEIRKQECRRYVNALGLTLIDDDYDHSAWLGEVQGLENEPERGLRCAACFRYRLSRAARQAHLLHIPVVATTLASSRWKNIEQINLAGVQATAPYDDVTFWEVNWRKGGLSDRRNALIKAYDFYNQQYCGCEFSMRQDIKASAPDPSTDVR